MTRAGKQRSIVAVRCHLCGDMYDDWADRLTPGQAKHHSDGDELIGTCPGCREARAVERAANYRAQFGQRERVAKPDGMTPQPLMDDEYRDRWARATGRGE